MLQTVVECYLGKEYPGDHEDVSWFCLNCGYTLCDACNVRHGDLLETQGNDIRARKENF